MKPERRRVYFLCLGVPLILLGASACTPALAAEGQQEAGDVADMLTLRAETQLSLGNVSGAIDEYRKALLNTPDIESRLAILNTIEELCKETGDYEPLTAAFRDAIAATTDRRGLAKLHVELGRLHKSRREFDDAIVEFEAAVGLEPNSGAIHALLADCYFSVGDSERAMLEWSQAQKYGADRLVDQADYAAAAEAVKNIERRFFWSKVRIPSMVVAVAAFAMLVLNFVVIRPLRVYVLWPLAARRRESKRKREFKRKLKSEVMRLDTESDGRRAEIQADLLSMFSETISNEVLSKFRTDLETSVVGHKLELYRGMATKYEVAMRAMAEMSELSEEKRESVRKRVEENIMRSLHSINEGLST